MLNIVISVSIGRYIVTGLRELATVLPATLSEIIGENIPQGIPEDFNPIQMAVAQWIQSNLGAQQSNTPLQDESGKFVKKLE
tara:strand:- start:25 stop:270 length:246 start_codon:yes stop_codon:yes gene_type:complete